MEQYKTFDNSDLEFLQKAAVDGGKVLFGADIKEEYSHDELAAKATYPNAVFVAKSEQEVQTVLGYAYEKRIPVTPRGSGTGLVGAAVPVLEGIVLDMSEMKKIISLDRDNLTVTVEPGVLLMELNDYLQGEGFLYPPDPGEKTATIGGNISTNAGGMRAVKYGVTRDYVRELCVILPNGKKLTVGGEVVKNSSGYALKDLFIGSEGTLGVITRAVLKLLPLPKRELSLLVPFATLKEAIDTVPAIIRSQQVPAALEFMQREVLLDAEKYLGIAFPHKTAQAYLLLRFYGETRAELDAVYAPIAELCLENGAEDVFIMDTEERSDSVWKARGAFLEAIKNSTSEMDEADIVVPRSKINALAEYVQTVEASCKIRIKFFGHAGDGNLHIYILRDELDEKDWQARLKAAMDMLYKKAVELDGRVSGEHGIGYAKREYLKESEGEIAIDLMRGIKSVFDDRNILNPYKII